MKNQIAGKTMKLTVVLATIALLVSILPVRVQAFGFDDLIDPFGLFDDTPQVPSTVITNSNVNSPNGSVNVITQTSTSGNNSATQSSTNSTSGGGSNNNNDDDDHDYDYDHDDDDDDYYGRLDANCYVTPTLARTGERVTWRVSVWGGTGSYRYDWNGSNSLDGSGSSVNKSYSTDGTKTASVKVTSGGRSINVSCDNSVEVYDNDDRYYNDNDYYYDNYYRSNLNVTCRPSITRTDVGRTVTWTASATGGRGGYSYQWYGDDYLSGSGRTISAQYNSVGSKSAQVTVYSDGQSRTQSCGYVTISGPIYNTVYQNNGILGVTCSADKASAAPYSPITWTANPTGGNGNYTYYWSGTDGLTGSQRVIATAYTVAGTKTATVTVSSGGQTAQFSCSNTIKKAAVAKPKPAAPAATVIPVDIDNDQGAALALSDIPWGIVAILVILVLFGTVIYLLFNKSKI